MTKTTPDAVERAREEWERYFAFPAGLGIPSNWNVSDLYSRGQRSLKDRVRAYGHELVDPVVLTYDVHFAELDRLMGIHRIDIIARYYTPETPFYEHWRRIDRRYVKRNGWCEHEAEIGFRITAEFLYPVVARTRTSEVQRAEHRLRPLR